MAILLNLVKSCLVLAKARVAPVKAITSIRASKFLQKELRYEMEIEEMFWTDSDVVLGYISNDARRFHVFVANRANKYATIVPLSNGDM